MNSFHTTLIPTPDKYYTYIVLQQNNKKRVFEGALQMLSSSGAGGLLTVQKTPRK